MVQPGSSVATALSEGEAKPKHVLVLEIFEEQWRTVKHPLQTVRPFIYDHVSADCPVSTCVRAAYHSLRLVALAQIEPVLVQSTWLQHRYAAFPIAQQMLCLG